MTGKIRLLILGTGAMAGQHAKQFKADRRVEIAACADVDLGRATAFAATHGIAKAFGSLEDAMQWNKFQAASNVTPDRVHHPTTMRLLAAGKHVLCEKPLAESFPLADEMAAAAEAAGLINMVNLSYRNVAALEAARQLIGKGEIGEVRHVEASYRQSWLVGNHWGDWRTEPTWLWRLSTQHGSRGVLGDVGIHILDFASYAVDMMPVSVQARLKTFHKAANDRIGDYPLDANDSATLSVEFSNGALGVIHASRFMTGYKNVLRLAVFGTTGAVEIDHGVELTTLRLCSGAHVHDQTWRTVAVEAVATNHRKFIDAVIAGTGAEPTFRRGAELQKILDLCFDPDAARGIAVR